MSSKCVSQIFKILFQTGNINIVILHGVFFSMYVKLKSSFFDKKAVKCETQFSSEASNVLRGKVLKENFIIGRSWSSTKLFMM